MHLLMKLQIIHQCWLNKSLNDQESNVTSYALVFKKLEFSYIIILFLVYTSLSVLLIYVNITEYIQSMEYVQLFYNFVQHLYMYLYINNKYIEVCVCWFFHIVVFSLSN